MPPKKGVFVPKNKRGKTGGDSAPSADGTPRPDDVEEGTPIPEDGASTVTAALSSKLSVADSDAASTAAISVAKAEAPKKEADEDAMDEQGKRLIAEAIEKCTVTTSTYESKIAPNSRDIKVEGLTVILNGKVLFEEATLALAYGNRYGLVGPNGCGKSLLLGLIGQRKVPLPKNLDVYHLVSEIEPSDMTALEAVCAVDVEKKRLEEGIANLEGLITGEDNEEQEVLNERICEMYEQLEALSAENAEAKAASILFGLGFTSQTMKKKCREFSGGWRMRISLARALYVSPTVLVLDSPTSHLDMEAVVWLERYLATQFKGILLMVSHSEDFLDNTTTHTLRVHRKKILTYGGSYTTYRETREALETEQMKLYEKQQGDIAEIKNFVARFGHGTKKMAQQAQSREKLLQKILEENTVEAVEKEAKLKIRWPDPGTIPPPVLQLNNVSFGYPGRELLYENVDFGVDLESRIVLVGPNGKGKTTMLKMMASELVPTTGAIRPHPHLRIARYSQHAQDALDLEKTPLEFFTGLCPDDPLQEVRKKVGRFGVSGEQQTTKIAYLSGGIRSRLIFALMALRSPHLLLLDEPTNGLDMETIDSLAESIECFKGGVVLVSHDFRLLNRVAKQIYVVDNKCVTLWKGDMQSFKRHVAEEIEAMEARQTAAAAGAGGAGGKKK